MKRLRQTGQIPAILYGHGEGGVMLSVCERDLNKAIDTGSHIVDLVGDTKESALIKDVQWDAFGIKVLHVDLTRVDATEAVEVTIPIELKGDPVGTHHGGTVNFHQHEITIFCPANVLPDKIDLKVSDLDVDQSITAGDIPLPPGAKIAEAPETPIVSCSVVVEKAAADSEESGASEPEVIGGKKDEEESS
ncbi:MAG: 50S ribosomal protein L25 [Mariniblastus sp.]|nr:50S ribosomal protein L25 [Mariniblastus sp.]